MQRDEITEPPTETDYISRIGNGSVTGQNGWSIGCGSVTATDAPVGSLMEYWSRGVGVDVRGLALNGHVAWYRTEFDEQMYQAGQRIQRQLEQRAQFEAERAERDGEYDALPDVFKARIDRFRAGNAEFRWQFEPYEMSCCTDAVKIAQHCNMDAETVVVLQKADYKDQVLAGLGSGHSGNSAGMVFRLAWLYCQRPDLVAKEHGAMVALVGCEDYGCTHDALES